MKIMRENIVSLFFFVLLFFVLVCDRENDCPNPNDE